MFRKAIRQWIEMFVSACEEHRWWLVAYLIYWPIWFTIVLVTAIQHFCDDDLFRAAVMLAVFIVGTCVFPGWMNWLTHKLNNKDV